MNFKCDNFKVDYSADVGLFILFSAEENEQQEEITFESFNHGQYLEIRKEFAKSKNESDWYIIETSESKEPFGQKNKFYVNFKENSIVIDWYYDNVEIEVEFTEKERDIFLKTLNTHFGDKVIIQNQETEK